jgi:radical SAM superfamily enzyme YgiQ (UPF0313 family)
MRIQLFRTPWPKGLRDKVNRVAPVGLEYVYEHIRRLGHEVMLIDANDDIDIEQAVREFEADAIGLTIRNIDTCSLWAPHFFLEDDKEFVQELRRIRDVPIFIGGPAVNLEPDRIREYLGADFAIAGTGFGALDEFLEAFRKDPKLPGRTYFSQAQIVSERFERGAINYEVYNKLGVGVATKFGCPFLCNYCDYPHIVGKKTRVRDPQDVVQEIASLYQKGVRRIFFTDANFNVPPLHAAEILRGINELGYKDLHWNAYFYPHPHSFPEEFVEEIARSGKQVVELGCDTLDPYMLDYVEKGFTLNDVQETVHRLHKKGVQCAAYLMFGFPTETRETILSSFENFDRLGFDKLCFVNVGVRVYRHTRLQRQMIEAGMLTEEDDLFQSRFVEMSQDLIDLVHEEVKKRYTKFEYDHYEPMENQKFAHTVAPAAPGPTQSIPWSKKSLPVVNQARPSDSKIRAELLQRLG